MPPSLDFAAAGNPFQGPGLADDELGLARDALRLLRRYKLLFCLVLVLCSIAGLAIALVLPPVYSVSSTVLVEPSGKDVVNLKEVLADVPSSAEALASEVELLSSREMLEQTVSLTSLLTSREFNPALQADGRGTLPRAMKDWFHSWLGGDTAQVDGAPPNPMNDVVDTLFKHLVIAPVGRSRAIRITCTSHDPKLAAAIVNALASVYVQSHIRMRNEATLDANDWIRHHIQELKARADRSALEVEQYRVAHGLVRGRDSLLVGQQVTDASTELTAAHAKRVQAEATLADAERAVASGQPDRVASVIDSPAIQQLRLQQAQIGARRAELVSRLGAAHPSTVAVQAQLRDIQGRISLEATQIVQGLRNAADVARADEDALSRRYEEVRQEVNDASTLDVGLKVLQEEADVQMKVFKTFLTRLQETDPQLNFPTADVRILSLAVPPNRPVSPKRGLIAVGGVLFGLFAAAGVIFLKSQSASRLRTRSDVERLIGVPLIGAIPFCGRRARQIERLRRDEAVATLWARMVAASSGKPPASIMVSSAVMREGKTTLTRLLGELAADRGDSVLIVDADLRRASLTSQIQRPESLSGLAEVVRGEATLSSVILKDANGVHVLPAGRCNASPVRLLSSPAFTAMLQEARRTYDLVIVDSPPVLITPDAWLIGANTQATLFVVRWGWTRAAVVATAMRQLSDVGIRCIGVVLSIVDMGKLAYYDDATAISASRRARSYYLKLDAPK